MARYPVQVLTRMTPEQAERLDEVASMAPVVPDRSSAVRRLIDALEDNDVTTGDAGEDAAVTLAPADVEMVLAALEERTRAYSELITQVRAIGHLLNTLVRLGHQIASYGRDARIPLEAVEALRGQWRPVLERATELAEQDAHVEKVVRGCRGR